MRLHGINEFNDLVPDRIHHCEDEHWYTCDARCCKCEEVSELYNRLLDVVGMR